MSNKIPRSWFDDPEWEMLLRKTDQLPISRELRQRVATQRQQTARPPEKPPLQQDSEQTGKEVVLRMKLALPQFKLQNLMAWYGRFKKPVIVTVSSLIGLICTVALIRFSTGSSDPSVNTPELDRSAEAATFTPLMPLDHIAEPSKGQSQNDVRYDAEKKVLGFSTEYNGAVMTISQQEVPGTVKSNPEELAYIASSVGADEQLETQKGFAYIATDEKSSAQTAVFATDTVLAFVRTNKKLSSDEWEFYINQLTPAE